MYLYMHSNKWAFTRYLLTLGVSGFYWLWKCVAVISHICALIWNSTKQNEQRNSQCQSNRKITNDMEIKWAMYVILIWLKIRFSIDCRRCSNFSNWFTIILFSTYNFLFVCTVQTKLVVFNVFFYVEFFKSKKNKLLS